ncbi:MAG: hypothetical protein WB795_03460 [Candidatus Acidiferrales bacterium]
MPAIRDYLVQSDTLPPGYFVASLAPGDECEYLALARRQQRNRGPPLRGG